MSNETEKVYEELMSNETEKVHEESMSNETEKVHEEPMNNETEKVYEEPMNNETEKDYARLIAAQLESARRLKIKSINNTLSEEYKKKSMYAIASGVCFAGLMGATLFSGVDIKQAIQTEIQILNSFDALKEYLRTFTPAMWGTMVATAVSYSNYIKHHKKYQKANQEFYDMMNNQPEDYQDIVEKQAKSR